jgi:type IV secretion system protein VirB8
MRVSESSQDVTQRIETGEYYRDALRWYSTMYHSPISERALLLMISSMAVVIILMMLIGLFVLLPVTETKTMIVRVSDSLEKVARVERMSEDLSDDPNAVVMDWYLRSFVEVREGYDVDRQQTYFRRVFTMSSPAVYNAYVAAYKDPSRSPTVRYERHTKRRIEISDARVNSIEVVEDATGSVAEVVDVKATVDFTAVEKSADEERKSVWRADITFRFNKIHVDQVTGDITPMEFKVTGYESKQLGLE